jgi:hypothetical protein
MRRLETNFGAKACSASFSQRVAAPAICAVFTAAVATKLSERCRRTTFFDDDGVSMVKSFELRSR